MGRSSQTCIPPYQCLQSGVQGNFHSDHNSSSLLSGSITAWTEGQEVLPSQNLLLLLDTCRTLTYVEVICTRVAGKELSVPIKKESGTRDALQGIARM
jgi:hypothetical protein